MQQQQQTLDLGITQNDAQTNEPKPQSLKTHKKNKNKPKPQSLKIQRKNNTNNNNNDGDSNLPIVETPKEKKIENLPPDLTREILSRLPIYSLFQARLVSPNWHSLINHTDHRLPKLHYTSSTKFPNQPTSLIFLGGTYHTSTTRSLWYLQDIQTLHKAKALEAKTLPFGSSLQRGVSIVGSCNGFVCLTDALDLSKEKDEPNPVVVVCNPVNGDWIELPHPLNSPFKPKLVFFGFGYNRRGNEYKLLRLEDGKVQGFLTAQILTLGGVYIWRNVETTTARDILWDNFFGVHVNGTLHWFTVITEDRELFGCVTGIKTFDLEEEVFAAVPLPKSIMGKYQRHLFMGVLAGCLMIVAPSKKGSQKVWLMKDNGSWTLQFIIPTPLMQPNKNGPRIRIRPLSIQDNGNVLLQYDAALFSYDLNTKKHELVRVHGLPHSFITTPHVGTLLTLGDAFSMEEGASSQKFGLVGGEETSTRNIPSIDFWRTNGSPSDAAVEKELGNEYFKKKKFTEAIDCYSRSISLSASASAFANRAMAFLKIRRFKKAESDCTEALKLDNCYVKAYYRRSTARKELGKLKPSIEDANIALRLEPDNKELKKLHFEAKALYDKNGGDQIQDEQSSESSEGPSGDDDGGGDGQGQDVRDQTEMRWLSFAEMAVTLVDIERMRETGESMDEIRQEMLAGREDESDDDEDSE